MSTHYILRHLGVNPEHVASLSREKAIGTLLSMLRAEHATIKLGVTLDVLARIFGHLSLKSREPLREVCSSWNVVVLTVAFNGHRIPDLKGIDHLILRARSMSNVSPSLLSRCESQETFDRILGTMCTGSVAVTLHGYRFITHDNLATICRCASSPYYTLPIVVETLWQTRPNIADRIITLSGLPAMAFIQASPVSLSLPKYLWYTGLNRGHVFREEYRRIAFKYVCNHHGYYIPKHVDLLEYICTEMGQKIPLFASSYNHYLSEWPEIRLDCIAYIHAETYPDEELQTGEEYDSDPEY